MPRFSMACVTLVLAVLCLAAPMRANAEILDFQANGNEVTAVVALPGELSAELTIRFEQVVGLNDSTLGLSVKTVNPLSPSLLSRLPNTTDFAVPAGFPVMITVEPPATGGLAFEGIVEIEVYTQNLHYLPATPLRLFTSSSGELFRDITEEVSGGSYRTRGSGGTFSDFLVIADTRLPADAVADKFDRLEGIFLDHQTSIEATLATELDDLLTTSRNHWLAGDASAAIAQLRKFETRVQEGAAAGDLPNVWRSARDLDNVDGLLRAQTRTLRFSIGLAGAALL